MRHSKNCSKLFVMGGAFNIFRAILISSLLLILCLPTAKSLQVSGLYNHRLVISNESDSERNRAFREALEAVVLKVTGEQRWLEHPRIEEALDNAQSYVEAISYSSESVELAVFQTSDDDQSLLKPIEERRFIEVNFAASLINELLADANIPVWGSNRPSVLVWMVLQTADGEREMLTQESNPQIVNYIQEFAARRAIPIIFPVLDFEDRRNLSEDTVWGLEEGPITAASQRYGADSILTGRLHFTAGGELVGLWQFIFQGEAEVFDGFNEDLTGYLHDPLDQITNKLASYFGIVPEAAAQQIVRLRVDGVRDLGAYSALLTYVSGLSLVDSVSTAALDGERLELELGLVGDSAQLFELISLDRDLLPIQSSQVGSRGVLHYRWTR
ncbi:MAG: hypothetical protein CMQ41_10510 [Gammaproteobacteria bacterium]|nr:hypothetical protein [Gammaproteobacteria bacterium]